MAEPSTTVQSGTRTDTTDTGLASANPIRERPAEIDPDTLLPTESARFWRLNDIDALNSMLQRPQPPQDPEERDRINRLKAELAEHQAKEAAVQARYARMVQARHVEASEPLATEQIQQESPNDKAIEAVDNIIALNERVPERPAPAATLQKSEPLSLDKDQPKSKAMPEAIAQRYLNIEDRYFLPDKTLAFEDQGNQLKLKTENNTVIRDALAIAEARGWQHITISGSQNFMHHAWREASLKGMEVTGYTPSKLEIAELNHAQVLREGRQHENATTKSVSNSAHRPSEGVLRGKLLEHGEAHYRHDPTQERSYFIKLEVEGQEVTRWGVDFPRALAESQSRPQIGDQVTLSNLGKKDVLITVISKDPEGHAIEEKKTVKRNTWQIDKAEVQGSLQTPHETLPTEPQITPETPASMPEPPIQQRHKTHQPTEASLRGTLLAHGADHYRHDPEQAPSYFITLAVDGIEITKWGADFNRAFAGSQSQPQIGDAVVLSNTGQTDVEIKTTIQDSNGNRIDDKKAVKKTLWRIEKAEHQDALEKSAEALRVGHEIERKVIDQMPQLAAALAVSKLGEKIAQKAKENGVLKSQDEVDTMVYLIREGLAAALKQGKTIKTPQIQEQGQRAAVDANSILNDHQPPEWSKQPHDRAMTR